MILERLNHQQGREAYFGTSTVFTHIRHWYYDFGYRSNEFAFTASSGMAHPWQTQEERKGVRLRNAPVRLQVYRRRSDETHGQRSLTGDASRAGEKGPGNAE